jgi:hypothetical protein
MPAKKKALTFEAVSPLKAWKGKWSLPHSDEFNGEHWRVWKDSVNRPKRKSYALTHLYCYAGLELIAAAGEWDMSVLLEEVQAWEDAPVDERIKLVAWIGRTMMGYMDEIHDPKE